MTEEDMKCEDMKFAVIVNGSDGNLVHAVSNTDAIRKTLEEYEKRNLTVLSIKSYLLSVDIK